MSRCLKAGTQRSLHSQRTFRSVFLLRFQFPKIGRTGNFRLVLACKSELKSNFSKKVPVPKLKREMSHQRVKPGEHMEIHSDGSHMHSDHFLGLVEARFRAKYDDRVLLAERPINCSAPEAAEMARDAGAQVLLLTYYPDKVDPNAIRNAARSVFKGEVHVVQDGDRFSLAQRNLGQYLGGAQGRTQGRSFALNCRPMHHD